MSVVCIERVVGIELDPPLLAYVFDETVLGLLVWNLILETWEDGEDLH
jgi:hypothetical protein